MVSTGISSLNQLVSGGYPDKSAILIVGPPGIGKEALGYWFVQSGLNQGDFCLYATRLSREEVLHDEKAFGAVSFKESPTWMAGDGGNVKLDVNDLASLSDSIEAILRKNSGRKIRVVIDFLSTLLMLNPPEVVYKFASQLIAQVKQYDAVMLATFEEGMHSSQVQAAMEQLFDGFIELSFYRAGLSVLPLLRVGKMRGVAPLPEYFIFRFIRGGIMLEKAGRGAVTANGGRIGEEGLVSSLDESAVHAALAGTESGAALDFLIESFVKDYMTNRLSIDQSGWRTRVAIAESTRVPQMSLYGREGKYGPILKELISRGLVEQRFFSGERGRGGEVTKFRVAYEKELVRRLVERAKVAGSSHHA